jgi:hypothetical protein
MSPEEDDFLDLPPLSSEDQVLLDLYVATGKPLDQLPYTTEFDGLVTRLGGGDGLDQKYRVFQRLLNLRKRGRLPRVVPGAGAY